ncbi:hypothetical protein SISSUDRAFT_1045416 [Sistotremastrum suecicum HHB10207 ss-3]|uniref:Uncharacterized protein n=1 Tax=Sistotremastrum suecicum HHB10207 ss-3 TaxID=1314776 RepID=A0A166EFS8_9AGAM|nr:hypothetical protein SISSUDRAFT_1045416 [Sistotremastrum suecicum HHB10207 ss-3]
MEESDDSGRASSREKRSGMPMTLWVVIRGVRKDDKKARPAHDGFESSSRIKYFSIHRVFESRYERVEKLFTNDVRVSRQ